MQRSTMAQALVECLEYLEEENQILKKICRGASCQEHALARPNKRYFQVSSVQDGL